MDFFSQEEKEKLTSKIEEDVAHSRKIAFVNQNWDLVFKIVVLFISISIVITSAFATSKSVKNPDKWSLAATILGGISTATSVFAFSQFNFSSRQQIWLIKSKAYSYLLFRLQYLDPNKAEWGKTKHIVDSWNNFTTPEQAILPEIKLENNSLQSGNKEQ